MLIKDKINRDLLQNVFGVKCELKLLKILRF